MKPASTPPAGGIKTETKIETHTEVWIEGNNRHTLTTEVKKTLKVEPLPRGTMQYKLYTSSLMRSLRELSGTGG